MEQFKKFLINERKRNGEKLMPSTLERYCDYIEPHFDNLEKLLSVKEFNGIKIKTISEEIINYMNRYLKTSCNNILYSVFVLYLAYHDIDTSSRSGPHRELKKPKHYANSSNSIKFLQSKVLSREELRKLLTETTDDVMKYCFCGLYDTAARREEFLNIKFKDIKLMNPNTEEGKKEIDNGIYAKIRILGKGGKYRVVYLQRTSVSLLIKLFGTNWNPEDYVITFHKKNGEPTKNQDERLWSECVKISDEILGRKIHPHCFRHTRLTHMADKGATAPQLMAYAGHTEIKMVMVYVEISTTTAHKGFIENAFDIFEADVS